LNDGFVDSRAAAIPRARGGTLIKMKLVCNQLAPLLLLFLQWMDWSCAGFLHSYLNLFHILIYKVSSFISLLASLEGTWVLTPTSGLAISIFCQLS